MPLVGADEAGTSRGRMTAYAFFVQTCREEHKKLHPQENVQFQEFSKKCASRWKTMTEREKLWFNQMADEDKKRFEFETQSQTIPSPFPTNPRSKVVVAKKEESEESEGS